MLQEPEAIDAMLGALGNERRRYVLHYTRRRGEVTLDELTTAVVGWRTGDGAGGSRTYDRVRLSLYHRDLPRLSEAGLVSVDHEARTVTFEGPAVAEELLDRLAAYERVPDPPEDDVLYRGV